jgi:hypothetical protein
MTHNEDMAEIDWDGWLDRLIEDDMAPRSPDVRAELIAEIRQAITNSDALRGSDVNRLAEIAVDAMIEFTHKNRLRPT